MRLYKSAEARKEGRQAVQAAILNISVSKRGRRQKCHGGVAVALAAAPVQRVSLCLISNRFTISTFSRSFSCFPFQQLFFFSVSGRLRRRRRRPRPCFYCGLSRSRRQRLQRSDGDSGNTSAPKQAHAAKIAGRSNFK